ncbi:MAG: molecular chaperone DnaJ, partial [Lachnospiraceae bacterium]|nr:molecular chaperone DnaJ [Lachnospiraceae bacterium]
LSFTQAALGDTIRIPTVDGEVEYELKAGTQPGTRIRLRGKGVPYLKQPSLRGDHYVTFSVKVPERLTKEQKEALLAFDETMGNSPKGDGKKKKGIFRS